jgi:glycine/D-amino acid oxidase-like deaminating enzyme
MQDIVESVKLLRKDGFSCKLIDESEINSVLSSKGFHGGAFNARDGEVNPAKLVNALAGKARENGTDIFEKTVAKRITVEEDRFSIKTDHAVVNSDFVVLATNAYTPLLNSYFKGVISPIRGQMLATSPVDKKFESVFYANYGYEYWRQTPEGRIIAGGFRELDFAKEKGYRMITTKNIQKKLEKMLRQFSLEFDVEYGWSGIMGFSKDHLPIIGSLPGKKNMLVSAGYSGHGLGFAFIAGRMIAEAILSGKQVSGLFSPSRFC